MKVRDLKGLLQKCADDAEVVVTMNNDPGTAFMVQSAAVTEENDLAIDISHYCDD
jgi:hypothetical protein